MARHLAKVASMRWSFALAPTRRSVLSTINAVLDLDDDKETLEQRASPTIRQKFLRQVGAGIRLFAPLTCLPRVAFEKRNAEVSTRSIHWRSRL